jgi:hypothetical protein
MQVSPYDYANLPRLLRVRLRVAGEVLSDLDGVITDVVLELGRIGQISVAALEEAAEMLEGQRAELVAFVVPLRERLVTALSIRIAECSDRPELLCDPPGFTDEPWEAERLQDAALTALETREQIGWIDSVLAHAAPGIPVDPRLAELDARLRALIPSMWSIDVERGARRDALAASQVDAWWWFDPVDRDDELDLDEDLDDAFAMVESLRAMGAHAPSQRSEPTVSLPRTQLHRLLATPRGQWLAERLGDRLDLSSASFSDQEWSEALDGLSVGDVNAPSWYTEPPAPSTAVLAAARLRRRRADYSGARERLVAATSAAPGLRGVDSPISVFDCHSAVAYPGVGVVARGRSYGLGGTITPGTSWLLVPEASVSRLAIDDADAIEPAAWRSGCLLWETRHDEPGLFAVTAWSDGASTELLVPDVPGRDREERVLGDPLTDLVRALAAGDYGDARSLFDSAQARYGGALSGLDAMLRAAGAP